MKVKVGNLGMGGFKVELKYGWINATFLGSRPVGDDNDKVEFS